AEARIAFGGRGRLRRVTKRLGAGAGDQLEIARLDVTLGRVPDVEHDRHAPRDHVGQRRRAAVVVDVGHGDAGALLEHLAGQVPDAARTGRGEVDRLRALL